MKKLLLLASSSVIFASPVLLAVSCGNSNKPDLTIGIRSEEQALWDNVAVQFEKATGKKVGFKWVSDQNNDYSLWSSSHLMPDIAIVDSGWAKTGIEKNWFQPIDLDEIATDQNLIITGQDEKYKENPNLEISDEYFETGMLDTFKTSDEGYNGLAVIYGPKISYAWQKLPKKDGSWLELYDGTLDLEWYVPNENGSVDKVIWGGSEDAETPDNSPLFSSKDNHRLKNTIDDVQEFLTNAVRIDDLKFNNEANSYNVDIFSKSPNDRVITSGSIGYMQRLASISKLLYDYAEANQEDLQFNLKAGTAVDPSMPWDVLAYGDKLIQKDQAGIDAASWNLDNNNVLVDNKVFSNGEDSNHVKWDFHSEDITKADLSHYEVLGYLTNFGYNNHHIFGDSDFIGGADDMQISFANQNVLFLGGGALWQWESIAKKITKLFPEENVDDLITSFGQPIQLVGADGYAISSDAEGEQLTLAKKFLRFLMQEEIAAEITGNKAKSNVKGAQALQEPITGARANGLNNAGVPADMNAIKNVPFTLAKSSTASGNLNGHNDDPIYDSYFEFYMKGQMFMNNDTDLNKFIAAINAYNKAYDASFVAS